MKLEDLNLNDKHEIGTILYKPGWSVRFLNNAFEPSYEIRVFHNYQPDASKFKTKIDYLNISPNAPVQSRMLISFETFNSMPAHMFYQQIYATIRNLEIHELDEWFKIDGKYFKNPHPNAIPETECYGS